MEHNEVPPSTKMLNYNASESNEEMTPWFISSACQLIPKSISIVSDHMHNLSKSVRNISVLYVLFCGSTAEFYIYPLNPCVGDVDALLCQTDSLAFCDNFPVLPTDLSGLMDRIGCHQIESQQRYPGFVRLRVLGEMNYDWNCKRYETTIIPTADTLIYVKQNLASCPALSVPCGPAFRYQSGLGSDLVNSIFCPQWPREARNWPNRPRNYGWPTNDVISEVVQNGCHLVSAQHPSCRADKLQWRLSFSFAEMILLQSWSQNQQIVYHLLRYFAKRELIRKDCQNQDEVLCTYHLKTLMLWTCEDMPQEWWNSSSVIAVCCELLKKLLEWLKKRQCPNYFIPEANLFHGPSSSTILEKTLKRISEFCNSNILCHWFMDNYILPVIQKLFKVDRTLEVRPDFVDYLLPFLDLRQALILRAVDFTFTLRFRYAHAVCRPLIKSGSSSGLRESRSPGLDKTLSILETGFGVMPVVGNELSFTFFDNLQFIMHLAHGVSCGEINFDSGLLVELINKISTQPAIIRSHYHNFPTSFTTQGSRFQFLRALDLMQNLTGSNGRSEFQLTSLMSKVSLRKALEYDDSQINVVAPAALAYLAAIHFASSEYQEAIRLCLTVLVDQTSQGIKETLNAGCLLFIDDVARIIGLCVLRKKSIDNIHCNGRRIYLDLRLSPKVFAHYLTALSVEGISKRFNFYDDFPDSAFPVDEYLNAIIRLKYISFMKSSTQVSAARQIAYRRADSLTETETTNMNTSMVREAVIDALLEHAFENVTSFYSMICRDFPIQCNTADCYRALYLYKRRRYSELLNLCEQVLREPDLQDDLKKFSFANVLLLPPLDAFFDGDIQSLLGFHTLFYYFPRLNDDMRRCRPKGTDDSAFKHWFEELVVHYLKIEHGFLAVDLSVVKRRYFLGRHFLARYLKVRCLTDCNLPNSEAIAEFTAQRNSLPLEHIIHRFLLQKLGTTKT